MEFEIFRLLDWCLLYLAAAITFDTHMCLGCQQVVPAPASEIPKKHHAISNRMGYVFASFAAMVCASFPVHTHIFALPRCPPPYLLGLGILFHLRPNFFWVDTPGCEKVRERDIYRMEFEIFYPLDWCLFFLPAVTISNNYMDLAWQTVEPTRALELPKKHHGRAFHMGYVFAIFIAMVFADIQVYTHLLATSVCPLPYLLNLDTLLHLGLTLFGVDTPHACKEFLDKGGINEILNDTLADESTYEGVDKVMRGGTDISDKTMDPPLMLSHLSDVGVPVPGAFSTMSHAPKELLAKGGINEFINDKPADESFYEELLDKVGLNEFIHDQLADFSIHEDVDKLTNVGKEIRGKIMDPPVVIPQRAHMGVSAPGSLSTASHGYKEFLDQGGNNRIINDKLVDESIHEDADKLVRVGMGDSSTTSHAYKKFLDKGSVNETINDSLVDESLYEVVDKMTTVGKEIRDKIMDPPFVRIFQDKVGLNEFVNDQPVDESIYEDADQLTGHVRLFSAHTVADDPNEMIASGKYYLSRLGRLLANCAFLVDGYVTGGTAETCARRNFTQQFLHYRRAGRGSLTNARAQRGYTAVAHTKISQVIGASDIHSGTIGFGKLGGDVPDKNFAFTLQDAETDGPYYRPEWEGMKLTTLIISGCMNALSLTAFLENLGH